MKNFLTQPLYLSLTAGFALCVALMVMVGWITQSLLLVQIIPTSSPMQFNTALCFFFSSLALMLIDKYPRAASALAVAVLAFALITITQYITGASYGLDTLFIEPFTSVKTSHIGRMAPNTATVFILLGLAIFLNARSLALKNYSIAFFAVLSGSLAAALGVVPLLGYLSGVETANGWENFSRMAVHTAVLSTMLGSTIVIHIWLKHKHTALWIPLPVAIGLTVVALSMAHAVNSQENIQLESRLQSEAQHIADETKRELSNLDQSLMRLTERWVAAGGTPRALWESDVRNYIQDYPFLMLMARLDTNGNLLWQVTDNTTTDASKLVMHFNEQYSKYSGLYTKPARVTIGPVALAQKDMYFLDLYPLSKGKEKDGFMVAGIRANTLFGEMLAAGAPKSIYLCISEDGKEIYSTLPEGIILNERWKKTQLLKNEGAWNWEITVYPTAELLAQSSTRMPWVVLGAGLLTSFLVTFSLALLLRKQSDALKLKEGEVRLRAVFKHAADGITLIDGRGNIEEFNPACEALFGYTQEEVLGKNVKILMPEPYHGEHDGYLKHYQETGQRKIIGIGREVHGKRKDGTAFHIDLRVSEVMVPNRKLYMGMFRDITERKHEEQVRQQLIDKLAESNTELERFAYVASHDLREPLRIVANFSTLLGKDYGELLGNEAKDYLALIKEASSRMHGMVGDLLEYARIGSEEMGFATVDMNVELQHVLENLAAFIQENHAVVTYDKLPNVQGNPVQLMRLLQNLMGNAIKFHSKGVIPQVHVGVEEQGEMWKFTVRDNGVGMAKEYTQQIFEPFRQLHARNEYMGTGIGLAICKRIVEKHRGAIGVTSEKGKGSVFFFTLPKQ